MCELQDEIYSDDSWLRLVELNTVDAIIDEALNVVWNEICGWDVMSRIKNETNMIDEKIHKVSEMDNDTQHLINDKLKEIMKQSRKNLEKIVV